MKKFVIILIILITISAIAYGSARLISAIMPVFVPGSPVGTVTKATGNVSAQVVNPSVPTTQKSASNESIGPDDKIKANMQRIAAQLSSYAVSNNGALPAATASATQQFNTHYINNILHPVTKKPYTLSLTATGNPENVVYKIGYPCTDLAGTKPASSRIFAIQIVLASGKNYCTDNS